MTKQRAPLSFERAIVRIADHLGWPRMGELLGRAPRTVMDYSDPDTTTGISLADAYRLEEAYRLTGGEGSPIADCWRTRLDAAELAGSTCRQALARQTIATIREGGEAHAALVAATLPGATSADRAIARREVEDNISALTSTLAHLTEGTGPDDDRERVGPGGPSS